MGKGGGDGAPCLPPPPSHPSPSSPWHIMKIKSAGCLNYHIHLKRALSDVVLASGPNPVALPVANSPPDHSACHCALDKQINSQDKGHHRFCRKKTSHDSSLFFFNILLEVGNEVPPTPSFPVAICVCLSCFPVCGHYLLSLVLKGESVYNSLL